MIHKSKKDIAQPIAERLKLNPAMVLKVIDEFLGHVTGELSAGRDIEFRGHFVLAVKRRKARVGRNPNNPGVSIQIPPRASVVFKPGKELATKLLTMEAPAEA